MEKFNFYYGLLVGIPLAVLLCFAFWCKTPTPAKDVYQASGIEEPASGFKTFKDRKTGISLVYPSNASATTTFLDASWRYGRSEKERGIKISSILLEKEKSFSSEVRAGFWGGSESVTHCFEPFEASSLGLVEIINEVSFHIFDFQKASTSGYEIVRSYRTVKNDGCYAFEALISGEGEGDQEQIIRNKILTENIIKTVVFSEL